MLPFPHALLPQAFIKHLLYVINSSHISLLTVTVQKPRRMRVGVEMGTEVRLWGCWNNGRMRERMRNGSLLFFREGGLKRGFGGSH